MSLRGITQDWEDLASVDPLWAVLSRPDWKFNRGDIEEFFLTGKRQIEDVMHVATRLGYPRRHDLALDFGCGVGRLTRPLVEYFARCYGVDVSGTMIAKAKELNQSIAGCEFIALTEENLKIFSDKSFDMVCSFLTLQHLRVPTIRSYIAEFLRILREDGLVVFQLLGYIPRINRIQPRRRLYGFLRRCGLSKAFLYEGLGLNPIRMSFIPQEEMTRFLGSIGARILEIEAHSIGNAMQSRVYNVTRLESRAP